MSNTSELENRLNAMTNEEKTAIMLRATMRQQLMDGLSQPTPEITDWVRKNCEELKNRVSKLTPNCQELITAWETSFDVDLFMQMIEHSAVDENDANGIVCLVFDRLQMLCAPVQDESIAYAKSMILKETNIPKKLAILLEISAEIISDIEKMIQNFTG